MGFCDLCGCHGDYYERMISLKKTHLKYYYCESLMYVCDGCFDKLKRYGSDKTVFNDFHFSKLVNEKIFSNKGKVL